MNAPALIAHATNNHCAEIRDAAGRVLARGEIRLLDGETARPLAIRVGQSIAVATGEVIGTGAGPIHHVYRLTPSAAFIAHATIQGTP